jgi:hypothetical protein
MDNNEAANHLESFIHWANRARQSSEQPWDKCQNFVRPSRAEKAHGEGVELRFGELWQEAASQERDWCRSTKG